MANPVAEDLESWQPDHESNDTNLPVAASPAGTGDSQDLGGNLRLLKSVIRALAAHMSWERWLGIKNLAGTGNIAFTFVTASSFTVNDNFTSSGARNVAIVGRRVRCTVGASVFYGEIASASWSSPNTTITVTLDSGALTGSLTEVEFGPEVNGIPGPIPQSRISGLAASLALLLAKTGGTMTGNLTFDIPGAGSLVFYANQPTIYLQDKVAGDSGEWAVQCSGTQIVIYKNTGTHAAPVYTAIYTLHPSGTPTNSTDLAHKSYVDGRTPVLQVGVVQSSSDFDAAVNGGATVEVTGMSIGLTTGARRCRVTFTGNLQCSNSGGTVELLVDIDGVEVITGVSEASRGASDRIGGSFSYVTDVLGAGAHTFKIKAWSTHTIKVVGGLNYRFAVEELPYTV